MSLLKTFKAVVFFMFAIPATLFAQADKNEKAAHWFPKFDFNPAVFQKPPIQFAPFARWWWPGNNVDSSELRREINLSFKSSGDFSSPTSKRSPKE